MKSETVKTLELMDALDDRRTWRDEAQCLGDDPARYEVANLNVFNREREAADLCSGCPVIGKCLQDAEKSFSMAEFTGVYELDALLSTTGVVRGGRVFE